MYVVGIFFVRIPASSAKLGKALVQPGQGYHEPLLCNNCQHPVGCQNRGGESSNWLIWTKTPTICCVGLHKLAGSGGCETEEEMGSDA